MEIKTKMDALQVFRGGILPRVIHKYEKSGQINHNKRRDGWNSLVHHFADQKIITEVIRQKWLTAAATTSNRFLEDLYKNKNKEGFWVSVSSFGTYKPLVESSYKGSPTLELSLKGVLKFPFKFGLTKAVLILGCLDEIRYFVEKHKTEVSEEDKPDEIK